MLLQPVSQLVSNTFFAQLPESSCCSTPLSTPSPALSTRSATSKTATVSGKEKRTFDLPCAICASPATGYHYNVASCNGCKTFFRRCVLSRSTFRCIRNDSACLISVNSTGSRIKCRSCRLDRCLQQGMKREAVTTTVPAREEQSYAAAYVASVSQPTTSSAFDEVNDVAARLRTVFELISQFRRTNIHYKELDLRLDEILSSTSFFDQISQYHEVADWRSLPRELPEWLTIDLRCTIELAREFPHFKSFVNDDQEKILRKSCFALTIAVQAIDSYLNGFPAVTMPDGTSIVERIPGYKEGQMDGQYRYLFVSILDPLYREQYTLDELLLSLNLLIYSLAEPEELTVQGKAILEEAMGKARQNLLLLLIKQDDSTFASRFGSAQALLELFVSVAIKHRQQMIAADSVRKKLHDLLIEQIVFGLQIS